MPKASKYWNAQVICYFEHDIRGSPGIIICFSFDSGLTLSYGAGELQTSNLDPGTLYTRGDIGYLLNLCFELLRHPDDSSHLDVGYFIHIDPKVANSYAKATCLLLQKV